MFSLMYGIIVFLQKTRKDVQKMPSNSEQFSFNVTKSIWVLNHSVNGWQKEVNLVAWNGKKPKLDIREWNADKSKMRRGITLSKDEAQELKRCLNSINISTFVPTGPGPAGAILSSHEADLPEDDSEETVEEETPCLPESDREAEVSFTESDSAEETASE